MRASRFKVEIILFTVLSLLYLAQVALIKPDPIALSRYHITAAKAHAIGLAVALPYIIIWFIALVGYMRLKSYQRLINDSPDGEAFRSIANGLFCLALFLPLSTLFQNIVTRHASLHYSAANLVRLSNYIIVFLLLAAMIIIYRGSSRLLALVRARNLVNASYVYQVVTLLFIAFSAVYVALVLHDPSRQFPTRHVAIGGYYEPDWLIVSTLIIPRLISWYLGLIAATNIYLYRRTVKGTLYRDALKALSIGIAGALLSVIVLRCIQTLSEPLSRMSLTFLLVLIYALLSIISIGYIFIARGAKNLQKLEEI